MEIDDLSKIQTASIHSILNHSKHHLSLKFRKKIWKLFGPVDRENSKAFVGIGLKRRTFLAVECARKVLPIWERNWSDDAPRKMMQTAQHYITGQIDFDEAWKRKNQFWGRLENLVSEGYDLNPIAVGFCSANVVRTAINDEPFEMNGNENIDDTDLDMYQWDASYYASIAFAEGTIEDTSANNLKRKEFWEWYINEAVMLAYNSF